jgi:outer membrane protein TolC
MKSHLALIMVWILCFPFFSIAVSKAAPVSEAEISAEKAIFLSIDQAVEMALKNNRDLKTARRTVSISASSYRAGLAQYYPLIVGDVAASHVVFNQLDAEESVSNLFSADLFGASAILPLDISGVISRSVQQSFISLVQNKAAYAQRAQDLIRNVYFQYTDILQARETIDIDMVQVEQAEEQLRIAEARLRRGRVPEVDVLTAQVQLDNARLRLKEGENAYELSVAELRNTLVINQNVDVIAIDRLSFAPVKLEYEPSLQEALLNRLEMQIVRLNFESAQIALKSTYDSFKPSMSLRGSWDYNIAGRNPSDAFSNRPDKGLWQVSANIVIPIFIFDGGTIKESKIQAAIAIEQARSDILQTEENIALEIKSLLITLENAQERVKIMEGSIDQAKESLRIAERRYRLGLANYLELTDASANLRTVELNLLNAIRDHMLARIDFYQATGRPLINIKHNIPEEGES